MRYVLPSASFIFLQINSKYDFILYKFRFSLFFFSPTHTVFFRNYYLFRIIKGSVGILFFLLHLLSPSYFPTFTCACNAAGIRLFIDVLRREGYSDGILYM